MKVDNSIFTSFVKFINASSNEIRKLYCSTYEIKVATHLAITESASEKFRNCSQGILLDVKHRTPLSVPEEMSNLW